MAKKLPAHARERRADLSAEGREAERFFRAAYAFGHVIYSARKARDLRQSDLAELSGVAQADISRIERDRQRRPSRLCSRLADALGAQIQFVLPPGDGNSVGAENHGRVVALSVGA